MNTVVTYRSGAPARRINTDSILEAITDGVLNDGDVEKALQRAFRYGTEEDFGLLDLLDRLREEIKANEQSAPESDQHTLEMEAGSAERRGEDAVAMRDALRQIESLDDLQGLDPDLMDRTLSGEEREWIEKWSDMTGQLIESGLVAMSGPRLVLTAKAIRQIGARLLQHIHIPPTNRGRGSHQVNKPALHGTPGEETSAWEWGKHLDLHISRSLANALRRPQQGSKLDLRVVDFEVYDREAGAAIHTVMLTDMSRSMFESGAWDVAKRAAIALHTLIGTSRQFDQLDVVGFSGDARLLDLEELPMLSWDQFSHGTNLHAGMLEASMLLQRNHALNQQVVIITDGEPTAYMDGSTPMFEHPVTEKTLESTLLQARRMSRKGIQITTVCVGEKESTPGFPRTLSRTVNGRLILLPIDELGGFIVRDVAKGTSRSVR